MPIAADLDHVALAADHVDLLWPRYRGDLGGSWVAGGETAGFYSAQVRFANGMKVEGLMPVRVEENDFLQRFVAQHGPGPHHLTFKVPDLLEALDGVRAAGFTPIGIELSDPGWKEAFLHPKVAQGIVIQLAQAASEWSSEPPVGFPAARLSPPAVLEHVALAVADLAAARRLFVDLLGGTARADGPSWVELGWKGPGRLRLLQPAGGTEEAAWLGNRTGRLHHLAFRLADPATIPGAIERGDGLWVVPPEANLGTRLHLRA